ncbi:uncharacterized protein TRAVEDRAFT_50728 [Trametes versicolor FP-101664 SS1]|uniref:uncharacterized protein n=1 Tax=Trametes versicolor (strain FP-101664) TaxID=717944 RepID=UPI0004621694|nr:uncharacterized protein TRAVEDRAFT_50728 [Trametes versicolor FP-101664 SS1]EIW56248.1 hypothetical protein TRAVEDRAFT_50728 [Trametes versicolor FP-101664 SS1]
MDSSTTPTEATGLQRHPELYFDDGDIVLKATNSFEGSQRNYRLFCVHQAVLSTHSPVFSNLFADASAGTESMYDGRSLIAMADDAADLAHLLLYLYDPGRYLLRSFHPDTAVELRGAVKLADKYLLDKARSSMIQRVTQDWPTTLDDCDINEGTRRAIERTMYDAYRATSSSVALADRTPEPVSTIVFAQEHGCAEILPAAFYSLASIDVRSVWCEDPERWVHMLMFPCARWELCDKDNLVRYITGRQSLEALYHRVSRDLSMGVMLHAPCRPPFGVVDVDTDDWPCLRALRTIRYRVWGTRPTYDPLSKLLELDEYDKLGIAVMPRGPETLCRDCRETFGKWVYEQRTRLWERLPQIFGLE